MTQNKKFGLIFFFLVIAPIVLILPALFNADPFDFHYYKNKSIVFIGVLISLISSVYLVKNNFSFKQHFNFMGVLALIFLFISAFILYGIYSLSNFGF